MHLMTGGFPVLSVMEPHLCDNYFPFFNLVYEPVFLIYPPRPPAGVIVF